MKIELMKVEINDFGGAPCCEHNYPCPIYRDHHAVYNASDGYFEPSWKARSEGWRLIKATNWFQKLLLRWFFAARPQI